MAGKVNPTVLRRQLAAELRRMREATGATVAETADHLGWSESKLSRIETANTGIRKSDLDRLLDHLKASESDRSKLHALAGQSRQKAWWEAYGDSLYSAYEAYIGFEAEATAIYNYQSQVVPGLLQTVEYAQAVMLAHDPDEPDLVAQRVAVRMARQAVLMRQPPPRLRTVLDEAVLRRKIGGPDVMRRQLLRLVELGDIPTITIQVLPFETGAHRGLAGSFVILEFAEQQDHPLVYSEGMTGGVFRNKHDDLRRYWMSFESLRAASLSHADSIEFIAAMTSGEH